jgi:hypothetical protein
MRRILAFLVLFASAASMVATPVRAVDLTDWPLRPAEGTRTGETVGGFTLQPAEPGLPYGLTLEASTAAGAAGSDTKVGPIRWMAPESIHDRMSATAGFGFEDGTTEALRLNGTAQGSGMQFDLEILGDRLRQHTVTVRAFENGNPVHEEAATEATSPLFEGSTAPNGTGGLGTPLSSTFEQISDEIEQTKPQTADRPGGGAVALLFEPGTTLTFGDVVVTADEVRVGIWGTTGTLFDVETLAVEFTPQSGLQPQLQVIDAAMGLNGHEVRVGNGGRGEVVRDADGRASLALRPSPGGSARVSAALRPGQHGVTMSLTGADGTPLAVPPVLTHQGRINDSSDTPLRGRRAEIVYGVRATPSSDRTSYEPILVDPSALYVVAWETSTGATGRTDPSAEFPATSTVGAFPKDWTLPPLRNGNEVAVEMRFGSPVDLNVGSEVVAGVLRMQVEMLMTLTADPIITDVDTDIGGLPDGSIAHVRYTGNVFGPGTSVGAPTSRALGDAVVQRAADGSVLVSSMAPTGGDPADGVEFAFEPVDAATMDFATAQDPLLAFRCGGVRASDPAQGYAPIEAILEPVGNGEVAVRFDARAITDLEQIDYEVLDGDGTLIERGGIVHRDIATRVVGTPGIGTVETNGGNVILSVAFGRMSPARSLEVDVEVRAIVPQSDFRVQSLQLAADGGAFFATANALRTTTDAPPLHAGALSLHRPFPNPFNPRTSVRFEVQRPSDVSLRIYDMRGRIVDVLVDERLDTGTYTRVWNGTDLRGRAVASGAYFVRLADGSEGPLVRRVVLVR